MMELDKMPVDTALLLVKKKGYTETFHDSIKEGEYFIEIRTAEDCWVEYKLAEQPNLKGEK